MDVRSAIDAAKHKRTSVDLAVRYGYLDMVTFVLAIMDHLDHDLGMQDCVGGSDASSDKNTQRVHQEL